jgi:putative membrane protein
VSGQGREHRSEERARSGAPRGSEPTTPSGQETQPERTVLAWQRTGLGVLALAGLLARAAVTDGAPARLAVAGGVALLGLGVLGGLAPLRAREVARALDRGTGVAVPRLVLVVTAVVVAVAVVALVAVLSPR